MVYDLEHMDLSELFDLLSIKTAELLKAIDRRNRKGNLKELKSEVEAIQAAIKFQKQITDHQVYTGN